MKSLHIHPIGTIHSPFSSLENMPIQPKGAAGVKGHIEILPDFSPGLKDLEGFSHIYLFYHFHKAARTELVVTPFMDTSSRGVFATRSPLRPNHIGMSLVKILSVEDSIIMLDGVDVLDNTPLLDIKPFISNFDTVADSRSGWMKASEKEVREKRSDRRFI